MIYRSALNVVFASVVFAVLSGVAVAQDYPTKPITLIVPWPAGGSTDIVLRVMAEVASKDLGQPIIVDNKAGGGGIVGPATMAASAKPDGYTISQIAIPVLRLPLMQDMSWDASKDFTYILNLTGYTFGVTTNAESQFKTWKDVVEFAKANPGKVTYGTPVLARRSISVWSRSQPWPESSSRRSLSRDRREQCGGAGQPYRAAGGCIRAGSRWLRPASCGC